MSKIKKILLSLGFIFILTGLAGCSKTISQLQFDSARDFSEGFSAVELNNKWGFINKKGRWLIKPKFEAASDFKEGLAAIKINDKWGFIDSTGKIVIEPKFNKIDAYDYYEDAGFREGLAAVSLNNKWGFINKNGELIIEPQFNMVSDFSSGLAKVEYNNHEKYIDKSGKVVIKNIPGVGYDFENGFALVVRSKKDNRRECAIMDKNGNIISDWMDYGWPAYVLTNSIVSGSNINSILKNGKYGFIEYKDNEYKQIVPYKYEAANSTFSEGLAAVMINGKWGYINKSDKMVIAPKFQAASNFKNDYARVNIDDKWGFINKKGEVIFTLEKASFIDFSEGLAAFYDDNQKLGFVDEQGNIVIPASFAIEINGDFLPEQGFSDGLCDIEILGKNKTGYINKKGKWAIPPIFDIAYPFKGGLARVSIDEKWGYIDKTGNFVWSQEIKGDKHD